MKTKLFRTMFGISFLGSFLFLAQAHAYDLTVVTHRTGVGVQQIEVDVDGSTTIDALKELIAHQIGGGVEANNVTISWRQSQPGSPFHPLTAGTLASNGIKKEDAHHIDVFAKILLPSH